MIYHCYYVPPDGIHYREIDAPGPGTAAELAAAEKQIPGRWRVLPGEAREYDLKETRAYSAEPVASRDPEF